MHHYNHWEGQTVNVDYVSDRAKVALHYHGHYTFTCSNLRNVLVHPPSDANFVQVAVLAYLILINK